MTEVGPHPTVPARHSLWSVRPAASQLQHVNLPFLFMLTQGLICLNSSYLKPFLFLLYFQLLLLLLSHFSHVWLCATPSLGFSRQEHWSGLPFPSPMHKSEKWKWSRSVMPDSSRPHGLQPTRLLHPWDFLGKSTGVGSHCLLRFTAIWVS